jgi:hypothetical protein
MSKPNHLKLIFTADEESEEPVNDELQAIWSNLIDSTLKHPDTLFGDAAKHLAGQPINQNQSDMSTPSREEFDARLREIATQAENRALRTDNKIDEMLRRLEARDGVQDERLKNLSERLQTLASDVTATRDSVGSLKTTIFTTAVASVLAMTALVYSLNTSLFSAFESGKTTATALSDATNKVSQATEKLDALSKQIGTQASPPITSPKK